MTAVADEQVAARAPAPRRGRGCRRSGTRRGRRRRAPHRRPPAGRGPRRAGRRPARRCRPATVRGRCWRPRAEPARQLASLRDDRLGQVAAGEVRGSRAHRHAARPRRRPRTSRSCAASIASPIRPAALSRGASANDTVSRSTRGGRDPGALEERRDPRSWVRAQALEADPGDRPVLADDRRQVGDRPDRRQVREPERGGRAAGVIGEEQLGDLERHAAPGQPPVRVGRIGPMRVDQRRAPAAGPAGPGDGRSR